MSDRVRSPNRMQALVVFALLLGVQPALGQNRPIISEVFQSPVAIQVTTGADVTEGVGDLTFDQPNGMAFESYKFHHGPSFEIITRYDLGKVFDNDPPDCEITEVTGTMPTTWGWVANAKQGPTEVIDGITAVFWISIGTPPEPTKRVALMLNDSNTPVVYDVITPEQTTRVHFLKWKTTLKNNPNLFKVPHRCLK